MPYCLGLQSAAHAFLSIGFSTQFTLAIVLFLIIITLSSSFQKDPVDAPAPLPGSSLFHILPFFRRRFDFLNWGFHASGHNIFRFNLLRNQVIVVSGESARQGFFTAKGLDLTEGFKILSGAIPMVRGVTSDLQSRRVHLIHKRLANLQRNAPLSSLIPYLLEDSRRVMESWGSSGKFDPFENVYELVFQLTIRSLSCTEIADDPKVVAQLKRLYDDLDTGTTPATVLLPWLPTPAMLKKLWSTKAIYDIVTRAIAEREKSGVVYNDTLQMLLDTGDEKLVVVGFIMGLLIAGARATGTTASWLLTFLGGHPEWRNKAAAEVEALLAAHATSTVAIASSSSTARTTTHTSRPSEQPASTASASTARSVSVPSTSSPSTRSSASNLASTAGTTASCSSSSGSGSESSSTPAMSVSAATPAALPSSSLPSSSSPSSTTRGPLSQSSVPFPASEDPSSSLSARLASIPLEAWESQTPVLDAIIRETTRVAQPHTAMRRNLGADCYIDGKRVPTGAYVVYPFSDVHLDPEVYPDPWKFDPSRSFPDVSRKEAGFQAQGDNVPFGYVGWGGGKTVCLGTRLAKVELKLLTAMFVLGFEHRVVDPSNGKSMDAKSGLKLPVPNWNDILLCRPPVGSFALGYERTEVPL